jgi:hypothetical protein
MLQVVAEQEHYLLISDGQHFTVVERRAGKFYPLCKGVRHGLDLDDETVPELIRRSGSFPSGMRSAVSLMLLLSGGICSSTSDETDGASSGTDPPVDLHPMICTVAIPAT